MARAAAAAAVACAAAGGRASSFLFAKGVIVVKCWFIGLAKGLKRYMHFNGRRNGLAKPTEG